MGGEVDSKVNRHSVNPPHGTPTGVLNDAQAMQLALAQARLAADAGEVPVGAVVLHQGAVIAAAHNAPIAKHDPSAHAEILALRAAAAHLGNYRLDNCELFVTLEPCAMCAGAMLHARLKRLVFGATDPKTGAAGSVINLFGYAQLNHHTMVLGGELAQESSNLLQDFFRLQRQLKARSVSPLRQDALRTPLSRFESLPPLPGRACGVDDLPTLQGLRLHYVVGGPEEAPQTLLCLHGSGQWSQVWLHAMQAQVAQGQRVLALDLIGFGKSDKPKKATMYTLTWHAQVVAELLERLDLFNVALAVPEGNDMVIQTLAELTMALASPRISQLVRIKTDPISPQALVAPYLDKGYGAVLRAFQNLASVSKAHSPHNRV